MDHEDGSIDALKAILYRPLQHWYRKNRSYVWLYCGVFYGLHLGYLILTLFDLQRITSASQAAPGGLSTQQMSLLWHVFYILINLLTFIAVLAVIKTPSLMTSEPEVELAYSKQEYQRSLISARLRVAYILTAALILPFPVLMSMLGIVREVVTHSWLIDLMTPILVLIELAYWLVIAAVAVVLSLIKMSITLEITTAIAAMILNWLVWMLAFRINLIMTSSSLLIDQVLGSLFMVAIWAFIFGALLYYLHRKLIPRLAARYLTN